MIRRDVVVGHPEGVHALVAHNLAELAGRYSSSIFLRSADRSASVAHVVNVLALGLEQGDQVVVWADGLDEQEALEAVIHALSEPR
ncbi:HPr family phosphocarrier protein [Brooklawnia propionicigenes]|uniref:HPr family phosphocarrier protein n=1 Tax=Brooklawnia propionicigenes TaxID=3041175 RepID=UPI0025732DF7|nr:HPr family phosphocarrier protein [Brooklawnia sp. SH051]